MMLDLVGCDVVEGRWSSSNLNALVHHIPVGSNTIRVLHGSSNAISKALCKVMPHMSTIEKFVGSTIAWPPNELSCFFPTSFSSSSIWVIFFTSFSFLR